jgi:hypothetical protein
MSAAVETDTGGQYVNTTTANGTALIWEPVQAVIESAWTQLTGQPQSTVPVVTSLALITPCLLTSICAFDKGGGEQNRTRILASPLSSWLTLQVLVAQALCRSPKALPICLRCGGRTTL